MKVAIIGNGWLGRSMRELFPEAVTYVRDISKYSANDFVTDNKGIINRCDIAFIGVPTPGMDDGRLDTSIVEECISWCEAPLIVVRSTVNPGDCETWVTKYGKSIVFQPEFLGETPAHPLLNEKKTPFIILGGIENDTRKVIELYTTVYNANIKIRQVDLYTAEVIKLSENRAIAFKVIQAQELHDACEKSGTDYYKVRDAVYGDDPRFDLWFTFIFPNNRGFQSSKCLKKDIPAWAAWAKSVGIDPFVTESLIRKSKEYENKA